MVQFEGSITTKYLWTRFRLRNKIGRFLMEWIISEIVSCSYHFPCYRSGKLFPFMNFRKGNEFPKVGSHIFERNLSLTRVNVLGRWKENLLADLPVAAYYLYTPRSILTLDRSRFFDRVIINCSIPWTKDNGEIWPDTLQYLDWNCTVSQQR